MHTTVFRWIRGIFCLFYQTVYAVDYKINRLNVSDERDHYCYICLLDSKPKYSPDPDLKSSSKIKDLRSHIKIKFFFTWKFYIIPNCPIQTKSVTVLKFLQFSVK